MKNWQSAAGYLKLRDCTKECLLEKSWLTFEVSIQPEHFELVKSSIVRHDDWGLFWTLHLTYAWFVLGIQLSLAKFEDEQGYLLWSDNFSKICRSELDEKSNISPLR